MKSRAVGTVAQVLVYT